MTMTLVTVTGLEPGQTTEQDAEFYVTDRLPADTVSRCSWSSAPPHSEFSRAKRARA
jgi:hypothetical protein